MKAAENRKLAQMTWAKGEVPSKAVSNGIRVTTSVVFMGPYGSVIADDRDVALDLNILRIVGGTGIPFVLLVLLRFASQSSSPFGNRKIELAWTIQKKDDMT